MAYKSLKMDYQNYTANEWNQFAANWLHAMSNSDQGEIGQRIVMLNFMGSAKDNWKFILHAFELADSDEMLGHIAAGPLEHFISKHGPEYINLIEELAIKDSRFNRLLTGVWKHLAEEEVWNRIRILQKKINNPLKEYIDE